MRNLILATAAAAAVLAFAPPAIAQRYGHNDYSHNRGNGGVGVLQRRIDNVLRSLGGLRPDRREEVRREAIIIDRQLRYRARNGLNPDEYQNFNVRIGQLERRMQWAAANRHDGSRGGRDDSSRGHHHDGDHDHP